MDNRFTYRIPMFTDKETFQEFQYIELGESIETTLCGHNGQPEQCTGMKDDKDKLIFENDIVNIWKFPNTYKTCLVKWRASQCSFRLYDVEHMGATPQKLVGNYMSNRDIRAMGSISAIEIIGNVWENPELLYKEQTNDN